MKKFRCHSENPDDYPGFIVKADFPDKTMVCFPLENLGQRPIKDFYLLVPEPEPKEDRYEKSLRLAKEFLAETSPEDLADLIKEAKKTARGELTER